MEKKYEAERRGHYGGARLTVMQPTVVNENNVPREVPSENVSLDGLVCRNGNPVKYRDCDEMGTEFCHTECEFGAKETKIDDVNLNYQNSEGK